MNDKSPKKLALGALAAIVTIVAVISLVTRKSTDRDRETLRLHEDCGVTMAELTKHALGNGKALLVMEHDGRGLPPEKQEWMRKQTQGFLAALDSSIEVTKSGVGNDSAEALRGRADGTASDPNRWRADAYSPWKSKAPTADAIVSFVGEPIVGSGGAAAWKHLPPVVCFSFAGNDVPALMEAGVVVSAIVPRRSAMSMKAAKGKSWFEIMYEVITPEGLSDWVGDDLE